MAAWALLLGVLLSAATDVWGCDPEQFRCGDGGCISATWVCDGGTECRDGSDEEPEMCRSLQCPAQHFDCGDAVGRERCVPLSWRCDGHRDCRHGADEWGCEPPPCASDQQRCSDGSCVSRAFLCDGDRDCPDGGDERDCPPPPPCPPASFRCPDGVCVDPAWLCDGDADCADGADERSPTCAEATAAEAEAAEAEAEEGEGVVPRPAQRCPPLRVPCRSGGCVPRGWRCDGSPDCSDGSDEDGCDPPLCPPEEFRCADDGRCVWGGRRCDGHRDCADGSDEDGCDNAPSCVGPDVFQCRSGECIPTERLCDGRRHCRDWSDEPLQHCDVDECSQGTSGCSHGCQDRPIGFRCLCPDGFRLGADGKTCEDVDECAEAERCAQLCINLQGAFKCACAEGYAAEPGGRSCRALAPVSELLLWSRRTLRRVAGSAVGRAGLRSTQWLRGDFPHGAVADVDVAEGNLYWADPTQRRLFRAPLSPPGAPPTPLQLLEGVPTALALDWVHHVLYWGDSTGGALRALPVGGSGGALSATIWQRNGSEPRGIALDPMLGLLFWSDCGSVPLLGRVGLNGAEPKVLLERGLRCPCGLALDVPSQRLYWADRQLHSLSSVSVWGGQRRTLLADPQLLPHPMAVTVFEDSVFWTDAQRGAVLSAPRRSEGEVRVVAESLPGVGGVLVVHPLRQPRGVNVCAPSNGGCEGLCLPAPHTEPHSAPYSCVCGDGLRLEADGRRCQPDPTAPTPMGPNSTTAAPQPHSTNGAHSTETHSNGAHSNGTHSTETHSTNGAHSANGTHSNGTGSTALRSDAVGPPSVGPPSVGPPSVGPPSSVGPQSGLVALAVLLPLALLGALWALRALRRWWRRRSSHSISFGNPLFLKEHGGHQWQSLSGDSGDSGV
uniref:Low-density lipoprotein receptor n=1 Tax=Gallus gallus TaxID=9031 RepID=Q7T2X3_CHICK|nr:low density lipoprotein receptor precursor [Gallus gallus]CAD56163.1 low-density lipoprotein receptor precursor [Gallus gallus]|eukprot:NP_989783.1 low density lipoprotein receptor precursor [Gallus gallus]